jgi:hypothetical protein
VAERHVRPATTRPQGRELATQLPLGLLRPGAHRRLRFLAIDAMSALFPRDTPAANQIESKRPSESAPEQTR